MYDTYYPEGAILDYKGSFATRKEVLEFILAQETLPDNVDVMKTTDGGLVSVARWSNKYDSAIDRDGLKALLESTE
jgi:hypothetical protein